MAQEIELKLSLPQQQQRRFAALELLQKYASAAGQQQTLQNGYFDTPEQQLSQHGVALRVRRQGEQYIQTLKTRGSTLGGLHQRQEWEWPVPSMALDLTLLPPQALPDGVRPEALDVVFHTDFQRTCWLLRYPFAGQLARIELVLDHGWVSTDQQRDPISEIELELKSGPTAALFGLALELAAELPLRISRISKAQKGYRLLSPERARRLPPSPVRTPHFDLPAAQQWLERIQALLESYTFIADVEQLGAAPAAFEGLRQQLAMAESVPVALLEGLAEQHQALRRLLAESDHQRAIQRWLEDRQLGLCLLRISQWLFLQHA